MTQDEFVAALWRKMNQQRLHERDLAALLDTSLPNVRRWLSGKVFPPAHETIIKLLKGSQMSPARPYHINHPHRYADGSVAESDQFFEVVGHRDGPVVARFYFYPDDPKSENTALTEAESLIARNKLNPRPE